MATFALTDVDDNDDDREGIAADHRMSRRPAVAVPATPATRHYICRSGSDSRDAAVNLVL